MAMEKFRAAPLPNPTVEYSAEQMRQLIRVLEVYFNQLDSLTPNVAEKYTADIFQTDTNAGATAPLGGMAWNSTDQTIDIGMDHGVMQQVGQELYARVENDSGSTIANGTVVGFSGVGVGNALQVEPYLADGTTPTDYILGVMTHEMEDGERGYATVWGHVREVDTSDFSTGDVLWASPDTAGAFTKTKPTAPDNVISMAVVTKVGETDGELFVRPVIEQQLYYGVFAKTTDQSPAATNTAYGVTFSSTEISNGITIGTPTSRIVVPESGLYDISVTLQYTSGNASSKDAYSWIRKNGTDVANSTRIVSINDNNAFFPVLISEAVSLDKDDYIEVMFAATNTNVTLNAVAATAFAPSAPAANLVIEQIQL